MMKLINERPVDKRPLQGHHDVVVRVVKPDGSDGVRCALLSFGVFVVQGMWSMDITSKVLGWCPVEDYFVDAREEVTT